MVLLKSFVLAGLATLACAKSAVVDLIPTNFDDVVLKSGKPSLVEFFAPWCGHCKNLAPIYEELASSFESMSSKVTIAKADCDAHRDLGSRFGVQGFPTLKFFDGKSDTPVDYSGGRDLESLTKFITEKTGLSPKKRMEKPSAVTMLNDASFKTEVGGDKHVLVAFTAPWCGHCKTLAPVWEDLAQVFQNEPNVLIAKVDAEAENSKAITREQGVTGYPTIKYFAKGSKEPVAYEGARSEAELIKYVNQHADTHRAVGGGLDAMAGTIQALDEFVSKFTGGAAIADMTAEVTKAAADLKENAQYKYAEYYVKVFDKLSKSDTYAAKELKRLDGILKRGGLAPEKLDEFTSKTNILRRFIAKAVGHESSEL